MSWFHKKVSKKESEDVNAHVAYLHKLQALKQKQAMVPLGHQLGKTAVSNDVEAVYASYKEWLQGQTPSVHSLSQAQQFASLYMKQQQMARMELGMSPYKPEPFLRVEIDV